MPTFNVFLDQDGLYFSDFYKALKTTATRLPHERHQRLFLNLSSGAFQADVNLQRKYLPKSKSQAFFQSKERSRDKIPVIAQYTEHLLNAAHHLPVEVAVASLIPCFYLYSELGMSMRRTVQNDNPYRLWIDSYSSDRFLRSTHEIIQIAEDLGKELGLIEEKKMIDAFVQSTQFEISFWDHFSDDVLSNQQKDSHCYGTSRSGSPV